MTAAPVGELPAAVQDAATAPLGGGGLMLPGGLDATDGSTASITVLVGDTAAQRGALPEPQHDAQATRVL